MKITENLFFKTDYKLFPSLDEIEPVVRNKSYFDYTDVSILKALLTLLYCYRDSKARNNIYDFFLEKSSRSSNSLCYLDGRNLVRS